MFSWRLFHYLQNLHLMLFFPSCSTRNTTSPTPQLTIHNKTHKPHRYLQTFNSTTPDPSHLSAAIMSVESSLLHFFLLCLTVYACNARRLSVMDRESSRQVKLPGQDMEEVIVDRTSIPLKVKLSMSEEVKTRGQGLAGANTQKLKDMKALPKGVEERTATISGFSQIESLVSVSWNVPHGKHREHPALNMDYSPPETRPPIHN